VETAIANPRGKTIVQGGKGRKKNKKTPRTSNSIDTLSAAAAALNLAVVFKSRAMTENPYNQTMMDEAKKLYAEVQKVRSQLLPTQHPDLYATKHSLAELLEATGDSEAANALRQEIIDTYDQTTQDDALPEDTWLEAPQSELIEAEEGSSKSERVVVERSSASSKS
jgi:hypothetical protein